eukprot:1392641-Amorphochlora_amoeboformis.AAC.1
MYPCTYDWDSEVDKGFVPSVCNDSCIRDVLSQKCDKRDVISEKCDEVTMAMTSFAGTSGFHAQHPMSPDDCTNQSNKPPTHGSPMYADPGSGPETTVLGVWLMSFE